MIHIKTVIREVEGKNFFAKELLLDGQHPLVIMQKDLEIPSTIFHQRLIKLFDLGKITYVVSAGLNNFLKETGEQGSLTFEKIEEEKDCYYISTSEIEDHLYEETKLAVRILEGGDNFKDDFLILTWR